MVREVTLKYICGQYWNVPSWGVRANVACSLCHAEGDHDDSCGCCTLRPVSKLTNGCLVSPQHLLAEDRSWMILFVTSDSLDVGVSLLTATYYRQRFPPVSSCYYSKYPWLRDTTKATSELVPNCNTW